MEGKMTALELSTNNFKQAHLQDIFKNRSAFLILGGPSLLKIDLSRLRQPGLLTMGVNNSPKTFRPHLWVCVDDPSHFIQSIWQDPTIMKFVPKDAANSKLWDNCTWMESEETPKECPNVWFFDRNERFDPEAFLTEPTINWGNHKSLGGGRSVMLPALRLLHYLGFKNIFLLGCDMRMTRESKYHFDQDRTEKSIQNNNSTYLKMMRWFEMLKPKFESRGCRIFNCNADSSLKIFPFITLDSAIDIALDGFPKDLASERSFGLYERTALERNKRISC
jgi:hypothetical protein